MVKAGDLQVLLVEDEPQMRRFLRSSLPAHGYELVEAENGRDALSQAGARNPDTILVDLGLPDMDGVEVTRRLRAFTKAPIIVLSARGQERDKVDALDAGADDYITKPFGLSELLARMRVARRHIEGRSDEKALPIFSVGNLRVDRDSRQVHVSDAEIHLTPIEYKLLTALVRNVGCVVTHQQLLKEAWGPKYATHTQYLHVYMGHLRAKLEAEPARPKLLLTEPGVGYRLAAE
ncbi:two-component system response regulator KdpE [soil metagenome]